MQFLRRFSLFFIAALISSAAPFLILPLSTQVLGPEEYGVYALLTSLTSIGMTLNAGGLSFVLVGQYPLLDREGRRALISTALWLGVAITGLFIALILLAWNWLLIAWPTLASAPFAGVILSALSMLGFFAWAAAADVLSLERDSKRFLIVTLAETLVWAAGLLICLFVLGWGALSLFVAGALRAAAQGIGALVVLGPYLAMQIDRRWLREILSIGLPSTGGNLMERFQTVAESYALSQWVGVGALGLFSHARQYRTAMMALITALSRSMTPETLEEARQPESRFERTARGWAPMYLLLTLAGIGAATLGAPLIGLLTNQQFNAAAPMVAGWMLVLLLQTSGRAPNGTIFANNDGEIVAKITLVSMAAGTVAVLLLVPGLGVAGALLALYLQHFLLRLVIQLRARQFRPIPFQDGPALLGSALVLIITLAMLAWGGSPWVSVGLFAAGSLLSLMIFRATLRDLFDIIQRRRVASQTG